MEKLNFFIQGNLDNPNHTLYLNNFRKQEVGRLFSDGAGLIASFTIDVVNHSLVGVKKVKHTYCKHILFDPIKVYCYR